MEIAIGNIQVLVVLVLLISIINYALLMFWLKPKQSLYFVMYKDTYDNFCTTVLSLTVQDFKNDAKIYEKIRNKTHTHVGIINLISISKI